MPWRWIYALQIDCLCFEGLSSIKPWEDKDAKGNDDGRGEKNIQEKDLETAK